MRVLQVTEAPGGGLLTVVLELSTRLAGEGHEVCLAIGRRPETPTDLLETLPSEVRVMTIPWAGRTARAQMTAARALRRLVREWVPEVVHLHSSYAGLVGALALPRDVPMIYTPHGYAFAWDGISCTRRVAYRAAERLIARRCTLVGAVSETEADLARRVVRARRVELVRNGIAELDGDRLPAPAARVEPLVIALGRIEAQRRPAGTARILSALADGAEVLWVGGAPGEDDEVLRAAGIPFTGWLSRSEALAHLERATVLLHWSASDGQPLAPLEAMARDVVVVASDIPPNRELVGPEQVCRTEEEAIALARRALHDPAARDRMIAAQRVRRSRHSAARMTCEWLALYQHLASDASVPRGAAPKL